MLLSIADMQVRVLIAVGVAMALSTTVGWLRLLMVRNKFDSLCPKCMKAQLRYVVTQ